MKKLALIAVLAMGTPVFGQSTEPQNGDKWAYFEVKNGDEKGVLIDFCKYLISKGYSIRQKDLDFMSFETNIKKANQAVYKFLGSVEKNDSATCTVWLSAMWEPNNTGIFNLDVDMTTGNLSEWQYKGKAWLHNRVYQDFAPILEAYTLKNTSVFYRTEKRASVFVADQKPEPKPEPKPMELPVGIPTYSGR